MSSFNSRTRSINESTNPGSVPMTKTSIPAASSVTMEEVFPAPEAPCKRTEGGWRRIDGEGVAAVDDGVDKVGDFTGRFGVGVGCRFIVTTEGFLCFEGVTFQSR
jgi:hypothetical protein